MKKLFCIYTLLVPFIAICLSILNYNYGVVCTDGCREHSRFILGFTFIALVVIAIMNLVYIDKAQSLETKKATVSLAVLNVLFCSYVFLPSVSPLFFLLIFIPAMISIPIQCGLWVWVVLIEPIGFKKVWLWLIILLLVVANCFLCIINM